ncbi:MAG TPA: efflux RND transporter periplasmic adaptor subunit [Steroidobacteraceae bacterium]|nr:efflux RND transporter periplasmic adaptor subunit [Steroidobacteraceae bacterium]
MIENDDLHQHEPAGGHGIPRDDGVSTAKLRRIGLIAAAVAILIAVVGILGRFLHERSVAHWTDAQAVPTVQLLTPERGVTGLETVLPGNIEAWYEAPIYARVSGYLKEWYFDYGAHVKKGQVLAVIDAPDLDAQLAAAKANLNSARAQVDVRKAQMEFARTTYIRWRDSPKGVVSEQEQESKKADYGSANAAYEASLADVNADRGVVDRLNALEQFKSLVAPFDGIVTERNTDIGALINAGSGAGGGGAPVLFKVAKVDEMRVYVQVPQAISAGIHDGLTATLLLPQYPERVFHAVVATTARAINNAARTLLVELHADNPDGVLQPGTYAEVHFELPADSSVVHIPTSALIFREAGMQVALVGRDDHAQLRSVTLGRNLGTEVEVLRGLTPSDRVINSPPDSLASGDLVNVEGGAPTTRSVADGARKAGGPLAQAVASER